MSGDHDLSVAPVAGRVPPGEPGGLPAGRAVEHLLEDLDVGRLLETRTGGPAVVVVVGEDPGSTSARTVAVNSPRAALLRAADVGSVLPVLRAHLGTGTSGWEAGEPLPVTLALLQGGTAVGPMWLHRLRWVAASSRTAATASALVLPASRHVLSEESPDAPGTWESAARAVAQRGRLWVAEVASPTRCVVVPAGTATSVVDVTTCADVPGLVECLVATGRRAVRHLVAPHVVVGTETPTGQDHGGGTPSPRLRAEVDHVRRVVRRVEAGHLAPLPRVLQVLHRGAGGTPAMVDDLARGLEQDVDTLVLDSVAGRSLELVHVRAGGRSSLLRWSPAEPFRITDTWRGDCAELVARVVAGLGVELVHVQHLVNWPLTTVPDLAHRMGVPLVVAVHDHYLSCPTTTLLDEHRRFCGGVCTPGNDPPGCVPGMEFPSTAPPLKHAWVHEWRERSAVGVLGLADVVVAPSRSAADVLATAYAGRSFPVHVVEHGVEGAGRALVAREGSGSPDARPPRRRPGPLRVLCPAAWHPHKGAQLLREVASRTGADVEWHVMGRGSESLQDVAVVHGAYRREHLGAMVEEVGPDLVGLFSLWAETYAYTLSEAWLLGVPVVATDLGAVAERVRRHGGGLLFPVDDPGTAAEVLVGVAGAVLAGAPDVLPPVPGAGVRDLVTMAEDYRHLYRRATGVPPSTTTAGYVAARPGDGSRRAARRALAGTRFADADLRRTDLHDLLDGQDGTSYDAVVLEEHGHAVALRAVQDQLAARGTAVVRVAPTTDGPC